MTLKGGSSGACAACKYRRRRCASDCQLAPYFPADNPRMFQNAHRLFGVSNIVKLLETLPISQKPEAMRSIIFHSCAREKYPVQGCLGVIQNLQYMIWAADEELKIVNSHLELLRTNNHNNNDIHNPMNNHQVLDREMTVPLNNNIVNTSAFNRPIQTQVSYTYSCSDANGFGSLYTGSNENLMNSDNNKFIPTHWTQNQNAGFHNHNNVMNDSEIAIQNLLPLAVQPETVQNYDEFHKFFDPIGDRQSFMDSKVVCNSSSEESVKDGPQSIEFMIQDELNPCCTITSVS